MRRIEWNVTADGHTFARARRTGSRHVAGVRRLASMAFGTGDHKARAAEESVAVDTRRPAELRSRSARKRMSSGRDRAAKARSAPSVAHAAAGRQLARGARAADRVTTQRSLVIVVSISRSARLAAAAVAACRAHRPSKCVIHVSRNSRRRRATARRSETGRSPRRHGIAGSASDRDRRRRRAGEPARSPPVGAHVPRPTVTGCGHLQRSCVGAAGGAGELRTRSCSWLLAVPVAGAAYLWFERRDQRAAAGA